MARAAYPKGTLAMRLRDDLGDLSRDEQFVRLFPATGQPAATPWRLALVCVLHFAEGLTDRQAADAVRGRLDWKYCLGLALEDPGFDASVLSEFRTRLVEGQAERLLLERLLEVCQQRGWLKARGRQRTDATHVLAKARSLSKLECVGETLRASLEDLAALAPEWLVEQIPAEWLERYGHRVENYRLPKADQERKALAEQIRADGLHLLAALDQPRAPDGLRALPQVELLRHVWQQYSHLAAGRATWRDGPEAGAKGGVARPTTRKPAAAKSASGSGSGTRST